MAALALAVALLSTALTLFIATLAAYALARLEIGYKDLALGAIIGGIAGGGSGGRGRQPNNAGDRARERP